MFEYYEDDEVFRDVHDFYQRLMNRMLREMQGFESAIRSGKLKGNWDFKPIDRPGMKGYVARGLFQLGEPMGTTKRRLEAQRDPLTDVFDEDDSIKIYMELPGIDKDDIKLNVTEHTAEVNAKNFSKAVELPAKDLTLGKVVANYKNGVLEITIPKSEKKKADEKKRSIKIE